MPANKGLEPFFVKSKGQRVSEWSRMEAALRKAEENYSTHKLEFLALYWAVTKQFHHYLYGAPHFTVTTDHNPLTYVQTSAKLDAVGHRWMAELGTYNFDVSYKPGRWNSNADALSRCPSQVSC